MLIMLADIIYKLGLSEVKMLCTTDLLSKVFFLVNDIHLITIFFFLYLF